MSVNCPLNVSRGAGGLVVIRVAHYFIHRHDDIEVIWRELNTH